MAQEPELSIQGIYGSNEFGSQLVAVNWMDDGRSFTVVEREDGLADLFRVDAVSGERELLVSGADLVPSGSDTPIRLGSYRFSADGSKLLIMTDAQRIWRRSSAGTFYVWDFDTKTLTPVSLQPGLQQYAKLSPDNRRVAFVRDNNIYLSDLAAGDEIALTTDGGGDIINGTTDWVYEEELSLVDGFRWSPDGARIAFWRFDQSAIPSFYLSDQMSLYPDQVPVRYPKAGTENSKVRLGVVEIESGSTTWIDTGSDQEYYLARMDFADSPHEIWLQRLNRHQNRMDLMLADVRSGAARTIMTDTDEAWLDIDFNDLIWIDDGRKFSYTSERDGYAHIYLFNRDGTLDRQLTRGEWEVLGVYGVDEERGYVYFTASTEGPLYRPLYRVGLDGDGLERLSGATGSHRVSFDPTFTYYVDTYSEAGIPPTQTLRTADGDPVRTLADNSELMSGVEALNLARPEFITVPAADGTDLNAWIIKPPSFDPSQTYPLLMYVYGGPGSQTVNDSWGGSRYLWHQLLASKGYIVASVDNRGTGARGAKFKKVTYLNLGKYEVADQIAAATHFASLPYVDAERIGIWGWSYGGYMASFSILKGHGVFKAAIAGAPVTDWRLYDTIYTERYMRTPQENPDGYAESAPQAFADLLEGNLLIVHGTGDDNVHPQNTYQLVEELIQANKQFQLRLYPNQPHGFRGTVRRVNLYTMMTNFLLENL
jgi:dipeptidyl-peptidase-4